MRETRNAELADECEKKHRICNFIIHGADESSSNEISEAKKEDEAPAASFIEALKVTPMKLKHVSRIGKVDQGKRRPIKVVMETEEDKNKIMANLRNLKDQDDFQGFGVTDDYTLSERQLIKEYADKAIGNNEKEAPHSKFIWRVRGTPKKRIHNKEVSEAASGQDCSAIVTHQVSN